MPKQKPSDTLGDIVIAVSSLAPGGSTEKIGKTLKTRLPRRTLQRHLRWLVSQGQLASEGEGRARRYRSLKPPETGDQGSDLKVSKEGEIIRKAVRAPLQQRSPVGYDRTFLERYKPNKTFYLSDALRKHLAKTGTSSTEQMPAGTYARQILDRLLIDRAFQLAIGTRQLHGRTRTDDKTRKDTRFQTPSASASVRPIY